MDSENQIRLSKEEHDSIQCHLLSSNIKFKFCNKHQRFEKNFRNKDSQNKAQATINNLLNK